MPSTSCTCIADLHERQWDVRLHDPACVAHRDEWRWWDGDDN